MAPLNGFATASAVALTIALVALSACAGAPVLGAGGSIPSPGDYEVDLMSEGRNRYYLLRIPPAVETGAELPLVLILHGGGGNPDGLKEDSGFDQVADREGFIAVYPAGTGVFRRTLLTWNSGTDCCGYALERQVDDVGFLLAVVEDVARRTPVDLRRIYATGHSNGGMMAHRLGAEASDRLAAIVPVAGAMAIANFAPVRPVPVLHIHSVDDPRALYEGGLGPPFPIGGNRVMHEPVMTGLSSWVARNGCASQYRVLEERVGAAGTANAGHRATRLSWEPCMGAPVEHWRLSGVGHGWPGSIPPPSLDPLLGGSTTLISAPEEAWSFFRRFSLP